MQKICPTFKKTLSLSDEFKQKSALCCLKHFEIIANMNLIDDKIEFQSPLSKYLFLQCLGHLEL